MTKARRALIGAALTLLAVIAAASFGLRRLTSSPPLARSAVASAVLPVPRASAEPPPTATKPVPRRPYNVLLIMIDSLRADMPWVGYKRSIAPWLTKFAERATLYPRAYSISSYTAKSVAPTLAGKYPSEMKRDGYFYTRWFDENEFVSERARSNGIRTLTGNGHGYFFPEYGLKQGWDDYRLLEGTVKDFTGVADVNSDRLNVLAKKMLSDPRNVGASDEKTFFAYFHFLDPHFTYNKHDDAPDFGDERRDLYDNEVHFTDRWVGDLVDWALRQPWGKRLAVIITADHGEGMGERGHFRHSYQVWESLVRVPLFIYLPDAPPRRIETPRGAIDLAPTIADLLGIPFDDYRGRSLIPEVLGANPPARPIFVDLPRSDLMDRRRAVIDGDYKLVVFGDQGPYYLFDVARDFTERTNLAKKDPEKLAEMKALFDDVSESIVVKPVVGDAPLLGAPPKQRY